MYPKKEKRGQRMDPGRKRKLEKTEPIKAMKVCGPISYGDQEIVSKCLLAIQFFKKRYEGEQLKKELTDYLYKDIERLLVARRAQQNREFAEQTRRFEREITKVTPRVLQKSRGYRSTV